VCEWCDCCLLKLTGFWPLVAISGLKAISVIDPEILASATDQHLRIPLSVLIQPIAHVQIVSLLAFIVSIADQDKLAVSLQFSDLRLSELNLA
ncbi:MAG: hypothetical protein J3Q66DRAFT_330671, partial [Benniella sp.]